MHRFYPCPIWMTSSQGAEQIAQLVGGRLGVVVPTHREGNSFWGKLSIHLDELWFSLALAGPVLSCRNKSESRLNPCQGHPRSQEYPYCK